MYLTEAPSAEGAVAKRLREFDAQTIKQHHDKSKFKTQHHGYALAKHTYKRVGARIARPLKTPII